MAIADVSNKPLTELISLAGRRAVVTGGAKGLGKAIGRRLAEAGAAVMLADVDEPGARAAADDLAQPNGPRVIGAFVDVAESKTITALADAAVEKLGGIDIWVNNAGIFPNHPLLTMKDEDWDRVLDINLRGLFFGSREAARRMIAAGRGGVIVNMASTAGFKGGSVGIGHYAASKHGIRGVTRQLALELAPEGIRVLGVAPCLIATDGVLAAQQKAAAGNKTVEAEITRKLNTRLGRAGQPDDVARVVMFCASDMAMFMTGTTVQVDAGELL